MLRTILIALDVDDTDDPLVTDDDLASGIVARLDEFYPSVNGYPFVPTDVRVAVTNPDAYRHLIAAASIGLEGADADDLDAAHACQALDALDHKANR